MSKFRVGDVVRLTDHRTDMEFRECHWLDFDPEWQQFWNEYVDRNLTIIKLVGSDSGYELSPVPDYIHDNVFFEDELKGTPELLPEELFRI